MKYWLLIAMLLLAARASALPILSLEPSSGVLGLNQGFTVDIFVSGIEATDPLLAFGFDVGLGSGLGYNGAAVAAPFVDDSAFFASTAVAGSVFFPQSGDDILLSTLSLSTGATAGLFDISIFSTPGDFGLSEGLFTLLSTIGIDATTSVEVVGETGVPLPSSLLLAALGVLVAGWLRRK